MIKEMIAYFPDHNETIIVGTKGVKSIWYDLTKKVININYDGYIRTLVGIDCEYTWIRKEDANYVKDNRESA